MLILMSAVYAPVFVGFVLHTSPPARQAVLGKYSMTYAMFLLVLCVPFVLMPLLARRLAGPIRITDADEQTVVISGRRRIGFACVRAALSLFLAVSLVGLVAPSLGLTGRVEIGRHPPAEPFLGSWSDRGGPLNRWGFGGPEIDVRKPAGTCRNMALGGSTTFLGGYVKPEHTFVAQLGERLQRDRTAWRIETVNAAYHAHDTHTSLLKYAVLLRDFHPDCVLVMHAINDVKAGLPDGASSQWQRPFERDYGGESDALRELAWFSGCGRATAPPFPTAGNRLRQIVAGAFFSDLSPAAELTDQARRDAADRACRRALPSYRRNLLTLGRLVAADGGHLVVASQPTMFGSRGPGERERPWLTPWTAAWPVWRDRPDVFGPAAAAAITLYNAAGRGVARQLGATAVDLERDLPPTWIYFWEQVGDGVHLNGDGCTRAADVLYEPILRAIPDRPGPPSP